MIHRIGFCHSPQKPMLMVGGGGLNTQYYFPFILTKCQECWDLQIQSVHCLSESKCRKESNEMKNMLIIFNDN